MFSDLTAAILYVLIPLLWFHDLFAKLMVSGWISRSLIQGNQGDLDIRGRTLPPDGKLYLLVASVGSFPVSSYSVILVPIFLLLIFLFKAFNCLLSWHLSNCLISFKVYFSLKKKKKKEKKKKEKRKKVPCWKIGYNQYRMLLFIYNIYMYTCYIYTPSLSLILYSK